MTKKLVRKDEIEYIYYSKVLKQPFESVDELREAEAAYYAEIQAREDKAATKKADAKKVEESFKALNQARKDYKENLIQLATMYQEDLRKLKEAFEADQARVRAALADAETAYATNLKAFTDKYPEGYHLTLKDGDFETTISSQSTKTTNAKASDGVEKLFNMMNYLFGI
jgi:uncharacterized protein YdiU (UPF0061 family)